jgi:hypothetical protein
MSSKEGMFSKELGHKSQGKKIMCFWAEVFFYCGRPTVRIRTVRTITYILYSRTNLERK